MLLLCVYFLMLRGMVCVWEFARASATSTSHMYCTVFLFGDRIGDHTFGSRSTCLLLSVLLGPSGTLTCAPHACQAHRLRLVVRFCAWLAKQWWVGGRAVGHLCGERGARVSGFSRTTFFSDDFSASLWDRTLRVEQRNTRGARAPNQPSQPVQGRQTNVVCGYIA